MNPGTLAYLCVLEGYFGLLGLWIAWNTLLVTTRHAPTSLMLAISTLPLLFFLRGLLHGRRDSFVWLGLLSLVYFIHGVGAAMDAGERLPGILEILFSLSLFGGSLARLRINPSP